MKSKWFFVIFAALALIILSLPAYAKTYSVIFNKQVTALSVVPGIVKLNLAKEGDIVVFYINSPGGDVYASQEFINAMQDSEAASIVYVDDYAASVAAFMTINADRIYMSKTAVLLFHVFSAHDGQNNKWVKCHIHEMNRVCTGVMTTFYSFALNIREFVSEEEYKQILEGKDIIVNADTLAKRSNKVKIYN